MKICQSINEWIKNMLQLKKIFNQFQMAEYISRQNHHYTYYLILIIDNNEE